LTALRLAETPSQSPCVSIPANSVRGIECRLLHLSGIVFVNRNGLRWRDAPAAYGPPKTLYNRWVRWSRMGVFARMLMALAEADQDVSTVMIDATHLKTHRTASSLRGKKGGPVASSAAPRAA